MTAMRTSGLGAIALGLALAGPVAAQDLEQYTYVSPSPSAINSYVVFVAIGEGYFADEGLEIIPQAVNGSSAILQALASGQAQFGRPGPAPVILANARGEEIVFIYNSLPRSSFGILVPEESEYQEPDELAGNAIGVGTADGAEVGFARTILNDYGMSEPEDYTFIPVGDGGTALAGLMRDEIVAYVGSTADRAILTYRGMPMRNITPERFQTLFGNGYAVTREFLEENTEAVEGFGRALVRANNFTRDPANRERVLEHLAAGNPQEGEDKDFANALLDQVLENGIPHNMENGWGYNDPEHWQEWHDSLVASGELEQPLDDLESVYTNQFIETWNAE
ncbi:ABC transporter substrate-binding protein [Roseitranquillus sediminis]|uniref:ABC transporter substrate-binding protein n=1 Tax=Roseitranquillus sediminis TaxID=2809051 RepID=UPI001D0C1929|nr:ABC transporter substrate-binding protein [Roseitranquillus sediminis]MBM9593558.1 ABC transporter substrate-binding protein [Roseitranquillus sediminis]